MYYGLINSMNRSAGYTARTTALISASGITDSTLINAINTLDLGIISNGLPFSSNDALYLSVLGSSSACSYNFLDTSKYQLTFVGGWSFTNGMVGSGTNNYADTGWKPSVRITNGATYGAWGVYIASNFVNDKHPIGVQGSSSNYFGMYPATTFTGMNLNDGGNGNFTPLTKKGFFQASRSSSTNVFSAENTYQVSTTYSSNSLPDYNVFLGAMNALGVRYGSDATPIRFAYISENRWSQAQQLTMNSLVTTFLTTLGLNV